MNQKNAEKEKESSLTKAKTFPITEVRCYHIVPRRKDGVKIRCNTMAMQLEFGRGTTRCRNCGKIFYFDVNTTYISFDKETLAQDAFDVLHLG